MTTTREISRPPLRARADQAGDDVFSPHHGAAFIMAAGGAFGLYMSAAEESLTSRQRWVARTGAATLVAGGIYGALRPSRFATAVQHAPSPALPALGLAVLAGSSPPNSPMFFPTLILTAAGAAPLGPDSDRRFGSIVGAAYLGLVAVSVRRRIAEDRQLRWNLGMYAAYRASAVIGSLIGRLVIDVRSLQRARQRDSRLIEQPGHAPEELRRLGAAASEVAEELDRLLLDIAHGDYGDETGMVRASIEQSRAPTHHLQLAPLLIAAARGTSTDLASDLARMVATYRDRPLADPVTVDLENQLQTGVRYDARTTAALLVTLKRALDNSILHGEELRYVRIAVRERGTDLELELEDDGAGQPPPPSAWGTGLSEARQRCEELGGTLELTKARAGVRLAATVPAVPLPRATDAADDRSISARMDATLSTGILTLKQATLPQGIACLACAHSDAAGAATSALFTGLLVADQRRRTPATTAQASALVALGGLLWPQGGRPASGWLGVQLIDEAVRTGGFPWAPTGAVTAALGLRALAVRKTVEAPRIRENLAFPLACAVIGRGLVWARGQLRELERQTVSLRQQAEYIESLVPAIDTFHDVVDPLKKSGVWLTHLPAETRKRLQSLSDALRRPREALRQRIIVPDPIADLQEHLAVRLAPLDVEVTVSGRQPVLEETREEKRLLQRARLFTALITLADEITDHLLNDHPPDRLGRRALRRVHLHVEPEGDKVRLTVQPILRAAQPRALDDLRSARAAFAADGQPEAFSDARRQYSLSADALAYRAE